MLRAATLLVPLLAGGCSAVVLDPAGDVALQQRNLIFVATALMLTIVLPVMGLTIWFGWRYRAGAKAADHDPDWDHSTQLELAIWAAPLLIIICLGAITWVATHLLDPYRPLARGTKGKPIEVQVVALDWKWLFIYPEQGIATVNELALPVDRPVDFRITASTVMNSFFVPAMAGQIYAMPGMETRLHAVVNRPGSYEGFSSNYSGAGFSGMHFRVTALGDADFARWVSAARSGATLDRAVYAKLALPSEKEPMRHFGRIAPDLYPAIVNMCATPGRMCMAKMMTIDMHGGAGKGSARMAPMPAKAPGVVEKQAATIPTAPNTTSPQHGPRT